ncbi:phosphate/phosphite/phosphonate ABC transporter substrate-binding protein [Shewanella sp.]|uniref:phosphate/phosphite/phosphonate ABC transporter substrate-binding protein n=1 Tax=Shewanella sp. TaxID=50422 RepID=UPI003A84D2FC
MDKFSTLFPMTTAKKALKWQFISLIVFVISWIFPIYAQDNSTVKAAKPTLIFGVVPQQPAIQLAKLWPPILAALSENANYQLQFATAPDIPTFEQRLKDGQYDIAYMNPYHYVVFHDHPGYQALAREKDKKLKGLLVVRRDSPIKSLAQLEGQTLAFPAPAAFAASVLPRAHLQQDNINVKVKYVGSHDSVYLAVIQGLVEAGGGVQRTFNNLSEAQKQQLTVLWQTPTYTPHAIATHPRVSTAQRQMLLERLMALSTTAQGKALLESVDFSAFTAAEDQDWDDVRSLKLGSLTKPLGKK